MRSADEYRTVGKRRFALGLILVWALGACSTGSQPEALAGIAPATKTVNGPQADYPVVIGEPYAVGETVYTPEDVLNYDEVGYAIATNAAGQGIAGAHHTLPLPSYVEVTSLDSGRTILVRLERRGPMASDHLIALSPAAMAQLGEEAGAAVRVRRVNPPEEHRALLRAGETAPLRMDTPQSLVEVLRRRLPARGSAPLNKTIEQAQAPAQPEQALPRLGIDTLEPTSQLATPESEEPEPVTAESQLAAQEPHEGDAAPALPQLREADDHSFMVQAAAFSTRIPAVRAAEALGGSVSKTGRLYWVRTGPFTDRAAAETSLANVKAAGYSEARIYTQG